jgi:4-hydroxythreonine-4-phosphate dehydrogenase
MKRQLLIFDLDGTLIDSRKDLATAVNLMRRHYRLPPLDLDTVTSYVGNGVRMLVTRAVEGTDIDVEEALRVQGPLYREHLFDETTLYPGVLTGLQRLRGLGHTLAVATNKPVDACQRLLDHFGLTPLFASIQGGGSTPNLKPHPEMIEAIGAATGHSMQDTWVIGDNYTDLESARRAGASGIFLNYGYGTPGTETPDLRLDSFDDLVCVFEDSVKPVIGLTMGDPAGIGPELCLMMLANERVRRHCTPVIFGNTGLLSRVADAVNLPPPAPGAVIEVDTGDLASVQPGKTSAVCGRAAYRCVEAAVREAQAGRIAALVTAPLSKEALHLTGVPFPGHTEILADLTGAGRYCMTLASDRITTSLVTTHTALANVPRDLSVERIVDVIQLTHQAMVRIGRATPRLTVCALNPHAGEHGLFGDEEQRFIEPALAQARREGIQVDGPVPPDTAFLPARLSHTDAYVCMYHDQGLIPFKMLSFEDGVNVTLGLPIVRTSPDHGTAFDLAWTGRANPSSMVEAVLYAARLCRGSAGASPSQNSDMRP